MPAISAGAEGAGGLRDLRSNDDLLMRFIVETGRIISFPQFIAEVDSRGKAEVRVGVEPTNNGFADRPLIRLGIAPNYSTVTLFARFLG